MLVAPKHFRRIAADIDNARAAWSTCRNREAWLHVHTAQEALRVLVANLLKDAKNAADAEQVAAMVAIGYSEDAARYELAIRVLDPRKAKERAD